MQSRIDKIISPATAPTNIKANDALVSPAQPPVFDEEKELQQIKALDALLTNKYANAYPISKPFGIHKAVPTIITMSSMSSTKLLIVPGLPLS